MLVRFDFYNPQITLRCHGADTDARVFTEFNNNTMALYVEADQSRPAFVELFWPAESAENVLVLGDAWERSYGDLCFLPLEKNLRAMPWYFIATNLSESFCFGVKTAPAAFVSFRYDANGIRALADCRCGAQGVRLNGRRLKLAEFIYRTYEIEPFYALCDFCKSLCANPILPQTPVYGGNDWYYAYGNNSFESAVNDAALQAVFAKDIKNRPFMVIDDGWEQGDTSGPWLPNDKFKDMRAVCEEIKAAGCRPGIWMRPLETQDKSIPAEMKILRGGQQKYLDPSHPGVQALLREDLRRIKSWGYELIKHDFSTFDLFGGWGSGLTDTITNETGWHFFNETKTGAEIVLDFYRLMYEETKGLLLIGCNTISHLCAGLVHLNRTGDDTSGKEWARTLKMGVNTLAFRLAQNKAFYLADADCVGILEDHIPWEKNRSWMELLAYSGSALFLSCNKADARQTENIKRAYKIAQQEHTLRPLDWYDNKTPSVWLIDGKEVTFDWS